MPATREIKIIQASNGHYTAKYGDYVDIWSSPIGSGSTEEAARETLAIFAANIAKNGSLRDRYPGEFAEESNSTAAR